MERLRKGGVTVMSRAQFWMDRFAEASTQAEQIEVRSSKLLADIKKLPEGEREQAREIYINALDSALEDIESLLSGRRQGGSRLRAVS
jgi:hypothetical protein